MEQGALPWVSKSLGCGQATSDPSCTQTEPRCSPSAVPWLCRASRGTAGRAGGCRRLGAAGTAMLQPGVSPSAGQQPGWRAGRAGSASRAGYHSLSIPAALLQPRRALACGDDGADDAPGLRRKAEKGCHGDGLCHFKEARRHSRPSLPDEPQQREARGAEGGSPAPPHLPGGLAGPQRCHPT